MTQGTLCVAAAVVLTIHRCFSHCTVQEKEVDKVASDNGDDNNAFDVSSGCCGRLHGFYFCCFVALVAMLICCEGSDENEHMHCVCRAVSSVCESAGSTGITPLVAHWNETAKRSCCPCRVSVTLVSRR